MFQFTAGITDQGLDQLHVAVAPAHIPDDNEPGEDFVMPATITVWPFGVGPCYIAMSIDAAELLATRIMDAVRDAKDLLGDA